MKELILTNLGGPRNENEIEKFLMDLFTDPYLFDLPLPRFLQTQIGKIIAKKRTQKVKNLYASLNYGGGSPIYQETIKQAKALEEKLITKTGEEWKVSVKMACGLPNLRELNFNKLDLGKQHFILPLYPQFSRSTTLSTVKIFQEKLQICPVTNSNTTCKKDSCSGNCKDSSYQKRGWINPFYDQPKFIEVTTSLILDFFGNKLKQEDFINLDTPPSYDWKQIPILFSAHGIPMRLVKKGDPYPQQVEKTKTLITKKLQEYGYMGETFVCYQSKVGPAKWTEPSTLEKLEELGKKGYKNIAVYPISFVSEHLETLEEIGVQLREHAYKHGIREYFRIPTLSIYPPFIDFLAELVIQNTELSF